MNIVEIKMKIVKNLISLMEENGLVLYDDDVSINTHVDQFLSSLWHEVNSYKEVNIHLEEKDILLITPFRECHYIPTKRRSATWIL